MGAGEPGMLSPSPPTHGPLARAAELRWTSATHWVCPVPLFPFSTVSQTQENKVMCKKDRAFFTLCNDQQLNVKRPPLTDTTTPIATRAADTAKD